MNKTALDHCAEGDSRIEHSSGGSLQKIENSSLSGSPAISRSCYTNQRNGGISRGKLGDSGLDAL